MTAVGIRELKNRLSEYLRMVRAGERVVVTNRGQVIAEIRPPKLRSAFSDYPPGLQALARQGLATLGPAVPSRHYPELGRALKQGRSAALQAAERGDR